MKEIILVSSVIISMVLFFLVFKTMKNETNFKNEITRLSRQINEINNSILIKDKNIQTTSNDIPENKSNNLQDEYNNYLENNFNTNNESEELSTDLKTKIDLLNNSHDINPGELELNDDATGELELELNDDATGELELNDDATGELELNDDAIGELELNDDAIEEFRQMNTGELELNDDATEEFELELNDGATEELELELELNDDATEELELELNDDATEELELELNDDATEELELNDDSTELKQEMIEPYKKYSLEDFEKLTIKELQEIARANRLKVKGKKNELVERVKAFYNFNNNLG